MNDARIKRYLEITPGALSWGIVVLFILFAIFKPVACAVLIIIFDFYWIIRTVYLTTLLIMAHRHLSKEKNRDWFKDCAALDSGWQELYHLVIFPVYKEGLDILRPSLEALNKCNYPKEKIIVVVGFEERNDLSADNAKALESEFAKGFLGYISTFHPDGLPSEQRTKGANATWAAKKAKEFIDDKGISYEKVIVSCFDADTCVEKEYFGCLSYHFLTQERPHQASYQPIPVYNNNIWQASSFARVVETSSSFCQMIEAMRREKFVTFSSHSMSFKTLVDIGYWPVDMISDDSVIYWKAFIFYKGQYRVVPLYITVSMDAAYDKNFIKTIIMQYKQKRRWAWGVENFPFVVRGFLRSPEIPLLVKIRRGFNLLESHVTWAVWAVIVVLVGPLPVLLGGSLFKEMSISYNLPRITGMLFNFTIAASIVWIILSRTLLPPRPKGISRIKSVLIIVEWLLVPAIILVLGSTPALDAQTRMMLGRYMEFNVTEKRRKVI